MSGISARETDLAGDIFDGHSTDGGGGILGAISLCSVSKINDFLTMFLQIIPPVKPLLTSRCRRRTSCLIRNVFEVVCEN